MAANRDLTIPVEVVSKTELATGIFQFELMPTDDTELPEPEAGAHIYIEVPNGLERRYSLSQSPDVLDRYVICVKREENGEGGSKSLCDEAEAGTRLRISEPTNDFPLTGNPTRYIFIAGGIGITPIYSMIQSLRLSRGIPFKLYYLSRDSDHTAYVEEFSQPEYKGKVVIHHTQDSSGNRYDLWSVLEQPKGAYIYCCGPRELMEEVRDMTGHWSPSSVHFEDFAGAVAHQPNDKPFQVKITDTDETVHVLAEQTIIEALRANGYEVPSSCESGTCGTCRSRLLSGTADHRDLVLSEEEQEDQIMVCVSRAEGDEIEIELPRF